MSGYGFGRNFTPKSPCSPSCRGGGCERCSSSPFPPAPSYYPPPPAPYPAPIPTPHFPHQPAHVMPSYIPNAPANYPSSYVPPAPTHYSAPQPPYHWADATAWGPLPPNALRGGVDIDGQPIYVGRAFHNGDWLPAKVIPGKQVAYVSYDGKELTKQSYQILCEQRFEWVHDREGRVPPHAVEGGRTSNGERLFIGRVYHSGSQTVGKIHPSHGVCYIPFDGREISHVSYEVLTLRM